MDGLWEYQVDDNWAFKVNGHEEEVEGVPPFHALILYEGLPAGLVSPVGGIIASGAAVNEKNLIKAMKKRLGEN